MASQTATRDVVVTAKTPLVLVLTAPLVVAVSFYRFIEANLPA